MSKRTDTTPIPKQAAAQELLESATALLAEKKDDAAVKEDAVNLSAVVFQAHAAIRSVRDRVSSQSQSLARTIDAFSGCI